MPYLYVQQGNDQKVLRTYLPLASCSGHLAEYQQKTHPLTISPSVFAQAGRTSLNTHPPATRPPRTQPPRTQPPRTQPPRTQPPRTQPPRTQPPRTERPRTQRPSTQSIRVITKAPSLRAQKSQNQDTRSGRTRTIEQFLEIYPGK